MNRKFSEQCLFKIETFCNIINVFTVTFDQFDASLLNKSIIAANQHIKMIYKRSCDTEDWNNDN